MPAMRPRVLVRIGIALGVTAALMLSGCSPAPPEPRPWPTKTVRAPAFGSLDEAFEAAVATYQRYTDLWNQIAAEGGAAPERLLDVMEDNELAAEEFEFFEGLTARGWRVSGPITFAKTRLVQYQDGVGLIQIYACSDLSGARLIDGGGNDVTPEREEQVPLMLTFSIERPDSVLLSKSDLWDRPGVC